MSNRILRLSWSALVMFASSAPGGEELPDFDKPSPQLNQWRKHWRAYLKLEKEGREKEARQEFLKSLEVMMQTSNVMFDGGLLLSASNNVLAARLAELSDDFADSAQIWKNAWNARRILYGEKSWQAAEARWAVDRAEKLVKLPKEERQSVALLPEEGLTSELFASGNYDFALTMATSSHENYLKVFGVNHPCYGQSARYLALLYRVKGQSAKAEKLFKQCIVTYRDSLGVWHPDYARVLIDLAGLLVDQGEYARGKLLLEEAFEIYQKDWENRPASVQAIHDLNEMHKEFAKTFAGKPAEPKQNNPLENVVEECWALRFPCAIALHDLGLLYELMGDSQRSEPYLRRAVDMLTLLDNTMEKDRIVGSSNLFRPNRVNVRANRITALQHLSAVCAQNRRLDQAAEASKQAADLFDITFPDSHPRYITNLRLQAHQAWRAGDLKRTEELLVRGADLVKTRNPESVEHFHQLSDLGAFYKMRGAYAKGEPMFSEALGFGKKVFGAQHPDYMRAVFTLGSLHLARHDRGQAEPMLREALEHSRKLLDQTFAVQSEPLQLSMTRTLRERLDAYVSLPTHDTDGPRRAYDHVLAWKGAVFARQRHLRAWRFDNAAELNKEFADLDSLTSELAKLTLAPPPQENRAAWDRRIAELAEKKSRLDAKLAERSAAYVSARAVQQRSAKDISAALPKDFVLVDYFCYRKARPPVKGWPFEISDNYLAAFILKPEGNVVKFDLGVESTVEKAVEQWRIEVQKKAPELAGKGSAAGAEIRRLVWDPLEPFLRSAQTILVSPDGSLSRFPFAAMPGKVPGTYALEERPVAVLPVAQLLPEVLGSRGFAPGASGLLLVGEVDFEADVAGNSKSQAPAKTPSGDPLTTRHGIFAGHWDPLPSTGPEADAIAKLHKASFSRDKFLYLSSGNATESALRELASGKRFLHLATHGYFSPARLRSALAANTNPSLPDDGPVLGETGLVPLLSRQSVIGAHPGLYSGIVLAGANRGVRRKAGSADSNVYDDGILTALEVAEMDLRAADLVVLSACETGLGETADGEGVLGLQRAFQVSGARTVITSLWKVDDKETKQLMTDFYVNHWQKKLGKLEALRQAQLKMLRRGTANTQHPYYWAAWTLSGDPGMPLETSPEAPTAVSVPPTHPGAFWVMALISLLLASLFVFVLRRRGR